MRKKPDEEEGEEGEGYTEEYAGNYKSIKFWKSGRNWYDFDDFKQFFDKIWSFFNIFNFAEAEGEGAEEPLYYDEGEEAGGEEYAAVS